MKNTELMRAAAEEMRKTAESAMLAAGDGPWDADSVGWTETHGLTYDVSTGGSVIASATTEEVAVHMASWPPTIAFPVAALLDSLAESHVHMPHGDELIYDMPSMDTSPPVLLAMAYLRRSTD